MVYNYIYKRQNYTIYRVIHKSVKHFKIRNKYTTQQIMVILTPIERETLQFFFYISQMLNVSTFGNTADIYAINLTFC
jgi:hypothetical protein